MLALARKNSTTFNESQRNLATTCVAANMPLRHWNLRRSGRIENASCRDDRMSCRPSWRHFSLLMLAICHCVTTTTADYVNNYVNHRTVGGHAGVSSKRSNQIVNECFPAGCPIALCCYWQLFSLCASSPSLCLSVTARIRPRPNTMPYCHKFRNNVRQKNNGLNSQ